MFETKLVNKVGPVRYLMASNVSITEMIETLREMEEFPLADAIESAATSMFSEPSRYEYHFDKYGLMLRLKLQWMPEDLNEDEQDLFPGGCEVLVLCDCIKLVNEEESESDEDEDEDDIDDDDDEDEDDDRESDDDEDEEYEESPESAAEAVREYSCIWVAQER